MLTVDSNQRIYWLVLVSSTCR